MDNITQGKPWEALFAQGVDDNGNVISPFDPRTAYWVNPTQNSPDGTLITIDPKGRSGPAGPGAGGPWTSQATADQLAQMLGWKVVPNPDLEHFAGGYGFNQPQLYLQGPDGRLINPGAIVGYFVNGHSPSYLDWWMGTYTGIGAAPAV